LIEIYYMSVGRGVNLLLNIAPDGHGVVPEAQVHRLMEFGDEIKARFAKPLAATRGEGETLELNLAEAGTIPQEIDHILLREDIRQGERVRQFVVEGRGADGNWGPLLSGTQIGARQLVPIPPVKLNGLRLRIEKSLGHPVIREFAVFHVSRPAPKAAYRAKLAAGQSGIPLDSPFAGFARWDRNGEGRNDYREINPWGNEITPSGPPGVENSFVTRHGTVAASVREFVPFFTGISHDTGKVQ
jgi:hypothetical protein